MEGQEGLLIFEELNYFMGLIVSADDIRTDPKNVSAVQKWPHIKDVRIPLHCVRSTYDYETSPRVYAKLKYKWDTTLKRRWLILSN